MFATKGLSTIPNGLKVISASYQNKNTNVNQSFTGFEILLIEISLTLLKILPINPFHELLLNSYPTPSLSIMNS